MNLIDSWKDFFAGGSVCRKSITQTKKNGRHISMPRVGFEPMIPVFERAKAFCALGRSTTVIGRNFCKGNLRNINVKSIVKELIWRFLKYLRRKCIEE
jgi:hypothetical protein